MTMVSFPRLDSTSSHSKNLSPGDCRQAGGHRQLLTTYETLPLGYDVSTFLRTADEVAALDVHKPFTDSQLATATALNIGFMAKPLKASDKKTLMQLRNDDDDFHVHGREVYWLCKKKQSESRFSNALFEKTLNVRSTFRTAKTITRLAAKYALSR
jgi:uncharacterized protein (DUF1697 family)